MDHEQFVLRTSPRNKMTAKYTADDIEEIKNGLHEYLKKRFREVYKINQQIHYPSEDYNNTMVTEWYNEYEEHERYLLRDKSFKLRDVFGEDVFASIIKKYKNNFSEQIFNLRNNRDIWVNQQIEDNRPDITYIQNLVLHNKPLPEPMSAEEFGHKIFNQDINVPFEKYKRCIFGSHTISEWLEYYMMDHSRTAKRYAPTVLTPDERMQSILKRQPFADKPPVIEYPFTSKIPKRRHTRELYPDRRLLKTQLMKPYYSPYPGCWEIDHVFNLISNEDSFIFMININTRFLVVMSCRENSNDVQACLEELLEMFPDGVRSLRGDGSVAYSNVSNPNATQYVSRDTTVNSSNPTNALLKWYTEYGIKYFFNPSPYTNHNRIVDSVIRTIRNAIGKRKITEEQLQNIVWYYNNTPHRGLNFIRGRHLTPLEMMCDPDLEWQYIRFCDRKLLQARIRQKQLRLDKYSPGNILMVHLDQDKTNNKFTKRRRVFDSLAQFVQYFNGNALVQLIDKPKKDSRGYVETNSQGIEYFLDYEERAKVIPLYCTRYVCKNIDSLPQSVINTFLS